MHRTPLRVALLVLALGTLSGCGTTQKSASTTAQSEGSEWVEPPVGSRIRKKSGRAPVAGVSGQQMDQARAEAAAAMQRAAGGTP